MEFQDPVKTLQDISKQILRELDNDPLATKLWDLSVLVEETYRLEEKYGKLKEPSHVPETLIKKMQNYLDQPLV